MIPLLAKAGTVATGFIKENGKDLAKEGAKGAAGAGGEAAVNYAVKPNETKGKDQI